jgi:hypothetical protein
MALPRSIGIVEVGPRDGLQNEAASVPTEAKLEFIRRAVDAGIRRIERETGLVLFERTTRSLKLTDDGRRLAAIA